MDPLRSRGSRAEPGVAEVPRPITSSHRGPHPFTQMAYTKIIIFYVHHEKFMNHWSRQLLFSTFHWRGWVENVTNE